MQSNNHIQTFSQAQLETCEFAESSGPWAHLKYSSWFSNSEGSTRDVKHVSCFMVLFCAIGEIVLSRSTQYKQSILIK